MARYDKYDPISGGFRARLNADIAKVNSGLHGPVAVSLNATGNLVIGTAGTSGLVGILVANVYPGLQNKLGKIVDVMTSGEIVFDGGEAKPGTPGTKIYAASDGSLSSTAGADPAIGWMTHDGRLVVRVAA